MKFCVALSVLWAVPVALLFYSAKLSSPNMSFEGAIQDFLIIWGGPSFFLFMIGGFFRWIFQR